MSIDALPALESGAILVAYRGSIAHGTYIAPDQPQGTDDKDVVVVTCPVIDYYFGQKQYGSDGTKEHKEGCWDIVTYEVRKFIRLLANGNPNVLSLLWTEPKHFLKITSAGQILLDNRQLFLGKHVYHSFAGYANSQLQRMKHQVFDGYMGSKRKALVEQFGYDSKNAAHCIRLLRMARDLFLTGNVIVKRPDAVELIEIKQGQWSLAAVTAEAEKLFKEVKVAREASTLPDNVNLEKINALSIQVIMEAKQCRFVTPVWGRG